RSPSDAALQIERNFSELKRLVSGKRRKDGLVKVVLSKTIVDWRKKFEAGSLKNWQAMMMYQVGKEVIQHLAGQGNARLHDFANAQLSAAVKFCGALFPPT